MGILVLERFSAFFLSPFLLNYINTSEVSIPVRVPSQLLSYLTGRSVHFEGNLHLPLAFFLFTSNFIKCLSPFQAHFVFLFHSCTIPALNYLVFPLPLSPSLISPHILFMSFPSVKFLRKHLRANSTEAISL